MAYISQDEKKIIAAQIKPVLAKFGLKGTLSIRHHSKLVLTISSGKIDFIENYNAGIIMKYDQNSQFDQHYWPKTNYIDINEYHYKNVFSDEALEALIELYSAMRIPGWKDETDIMTDYFAISYYVDINIGTYNKSYKLIV